MAEDSGITLFCGALPQDCTDEELTAYFNQFGEVECTVKQDQITGRCRGFGFLTFQSEDAVEKVIAQHSEHTIRGKWVDVKRHQGKGGGDKGKGKGKGKGKSKGYEDYGKPAYGKPDYSAPPPYSGHVSSPSVADPEKSQTLFVGGLATTVTDEDFSTYFSTFGALKATQVKFDVATGRSRGFGFVEFEDPQVTETVLALRDTLSIHDKWVDCKVYDKGGSKGKGKGYSEYAVSPYSKGKSYKGYGGSSGYESPSSGKGYSSYGKYGKDSGDYGKSYGKSAYDYSSYGKASSYGSYGKGKSAPSAYESYGASAYETPPSAYESYGKGKSAPARYSPYGV